MPGGFVASPFSAGENGPTLTAAAAASMLPTSRVYPLPVPLFGDIGSWLELYLAGQISTAGASPGTGTIDVKYGSTTIFTFTTPTFAVSQSQIPWIINLRLYATAIGSAATVKGIGYLVCPGLIASNPVVMLSGAPPANGSSFDARASQNLDINWTFSATGNSLTVHHWHPRWAA